MKKIDKAKLWLKNLFTIATWKERGAAILGGLWGGLKDAWGSIKAWFSEKLEWFRNLFPATDDSAAKEGPLSGLVTSGGAVWGNVMSGLRTAMSKIPGAGLIRRGLGAIGSVVKGAMNPGAAFAKIGKRIAAAAESAQQAVAAAKQKFFGGLKALADDAAQAAAILLPVLSTLSDITDQLDATFMGFAQMLRRTSQIFSGRGRQAVNVDQLTSRIASAAAGIVEMTNMLSTVKTQELRTKVEEVLGTDLFTAQAKGGAGKVQINIHVNMDARKFATAMVNTNIIPGTGN